MSLAGGALPGISFLPQTALSLRTDEDCGPHVCLPLNYWDKEIGSSVLREENTE